MINATYTGVRELNVGQDPYWLRLYAGWGYPSFPAWVPEYAPDMVMTA